MAVARIESLAHGPHGIARIDGKVHFVRQVVPGDEVEVEVEEDHRAYAYARATSVLVAGAARRVAPCPYLPRCGGCLVAAHRLRRPRRRRRRARCASCWRASAASTRASSVRSLRAAEEYGYRRRLSLRVEGGEVGFLAAASHDVVPVERCLIAQDRLEGAIALVRDVARGDSRRASSGSRSSRPARTGRVALVAQAEGDLVASDAEAAEAMLRREPRHRGTGAARQGLPPSLGRRSRARAADRRRRDVASRRRLQPGERPRQRRADPRRARAGRGDARSSAWPTSTPARAT